MNGVRGNFAIAAAIGVVMGGLVAAGPRQDANTPVDEVPSAHADRPVASGSGSFRFGDHDAGVATFSFTVSDGKSPSGSLFFGAENHDDDHAAYPGIVLRSEAITRVTRRGNRLVFEGFGALHDDPVTFEVTATRGAESDTFAISVVEAGDHESEPFKAEGILFNGSITFE